uniref:SAP domain-containing protein n=1 Tax=Plectus sambesii TaxID=2011161 RepID=A0A914US44_9BILA
PAKDFEKIAKINATINRMTVGQVREELSTLRLDTRGNKATLVKRLKSYYKRRRLEALNRAPKKKNTPDRYYDYLLVLDFECTCEDNVYEYNHEIIEFPVVLVCTKQMRIVDEFHAYVKPQMHAQLSDFCSRLTGISQAQVDAARPFPAVFDDFRAWMCQRNLIDGGCRFAFVTDGPWDLAKFFQMQCYHSGYDTVPHDFRYWVNVRRTFTNQMGKPGQQGHKGPHDWKNLAGMLTALGMKFEGREHSGIDDARNIARIVIYMLQHGCDLRVNERLMRRDVAEKKLEERRNRSNYKPYPPRDATLLSGTEPRSKSPEVYHFFHSFRIVFS